MMMWPNARYVGGAGGVEDSGKFSEYDAKTKLYSPSTSGSGWDDATTQVGDMSVGMEMGLPVMPAKGEVGGSVV